MLNKLDGKVIVDRELFRALYLLARNSDTGKMREEDVVTCRELWNQDLTGWVATVAKPSESMLVESAGELPEYRPDDPEWDQMEYEIVSAERHLSVTIYHTMLNASPPLPGGGE